MELSDSERKRLAKLPPAARAQAALDLQREHLAVVGELGELRRQAVKEMLAGGTRVMDAAEQLSVGRQEIYRLAKG